MLRTRRFRSFWGVLGNYWNIINRIGEAVNAEQERLRRIRDGVR